MKTCNICQKRKQESQFYLCGARRREKCKECCKVYAQNRYNKAVGKPVRAIKRVRRKVRRKKSSTPPKIINPAPPKAYWYEPVNPFMKNIS